MSSGNVVGSIVWVAATNTLSFVKTGGVLANDTYTVTLFSGAEAFHDSLGNNLDGDSDGNDTEMPDNYTNSFMINAAAGTRVVSVRDFARGPGQDVDDVPETANSQLAVQVDDATLLRSLDFWFNYDTDLLQINGGPFAGASLATGVPGDWTIFVDNSTAGVLKVSASGVTPLSGSNVPVVIIDASVPAAALYGDSEVLRLTNTSTSVQSGMLTVPVASLGDFAIHKDVYLGDADGSGVYSGTDSARIQRVATGTDSGFDAHDWTDPVIVADVDRDGVVTGGDASIVLQRAAALPTPQIPTPVIAVTHVGGGVDPQLSIADNISVVAGTQVTIPVSILTDANTYVDGATFTVVYDTAVLDYVSSARGVDFPMANGWSLLVNENPDGTLNVAMGSVAGHSTDVTPDLLEILKLTFNVLANAPAGTSDLDVEPVDPNEGGLMWTANDGSVDVTNLIGDYNRNGVVESGDYVVWRKTLGNSVPNFSGADGDGDGVVDQDDLDVWRANFGNTVPGSGSGAASSSSSAASSTTAPASETVSVPAQDVAQQSGGGSVAATTNDAAPAIVAASAPVEVAEIVALASPSAEPAEALTAYEPAASVEFVSAISPTVAVVTHEKATAAAATAVRQLARDEALADLSTRPSSPSLGRMHRGRSAALRSRNVELKSATSDSLLIDLAFDAKGDRQADSQVSVPERNEDNVDAMDDLFAELGSRKLVSLAL